jgi:hypothetical protein
MIRRFFLEKAGYSSKKHCSDCAYSKVEADGVLVCQFPDLPKQQIEWLLRSKLDEEGFPAQTPGPCPQWQDTVEGV